MVKNGCYHRNTYNGRSVCKLKQLQPINTLKGSSWLDYLRLLIFIDINFFIKTYFKHKKCKALPMLCDTNAEKVLGVELSTLLLN